MGKAYYWDKVSNEIGKVIRSTFNKNMSICEIGFSGGHFLEWLEDIGYRNLSGIEIRTDQFKKTSEKFLAKGLKSNLICGDVLEIEEQFDGVFSTGLIQCLNKEERLRFIKHVANIAGMAIFTVPEIITDRNIGSVCKTAVDGCPEYQTSNIPYELSKFYDLVRIGRIEKKLTGINDTFIYYVCKRG